MSNNDVPDYITAARGRRPTTIIVAALAPALDGLEAAARRWPHLPLRAASIGPAGDTLNIQIETPTYAGVLAWAHALGLDLGTVAAFDTLPSFSNADLNGLRVSVFSQDVGETPNGGLPAYGAGTALDPAILALREVIAVAPKLPAWGVDMDTGVDFDEPVAAHVHLGSEAQVAAWSAVLPDISVSDLGQTCTPLTGLIEHTARGVIAGVAFTAQASVRRRSAAA